MNVNSQIINLFSQERGTEYPQPVYTRTDNTTIVNVPYVISENEGEYIWITFKMKEYDYHYRGLVDAIIALKYDLSETLAILLNYMDDPTIEKHKQEYEELQTWRKQAKEYSKKHFNL